jgi:transcriptional regulator with XRE-family HTH domain
MSTWDTAPLPPPPYPPAAWIGGQLRARRLAHHLSQRQVAQMIGLKSHTYLGAIEHGRHAMSVETLVRILRALETPIQEFFAGIP